MMASGEGSAYASSEVSTPPYPQCASSGSHTSTFATREFVDQPVSFAPKVDSASRDLYQRSRVLLLSIEQRMTGKHWVGSGPGVARSMRAAAFHDRRAPAYPESELPYASAGYART